VLLSALWDLVRIGLPLPLIRNERIKAPFAVPGEFRD
jgi:hypothetical protein